MRDVTTGEVQPANTSLPAKWMRILFGMARRNDVTGPVGGHPMGAPPSAAYDGGEGYLHGAGVAPQSVDVAASRSLNARQPAARQLAGGVYAPKGGAYQVESSDELYFGGSAGLAPVYQRGYAVKRATRYGMEGWASLRAWGSSSTASGPEGTVILFPPRIPRALARPRSFNSGPGLYNMANDVVETPAINIGQAALKG